MRLIHILIFSVLLLTPVAPAQAGEFVLRQASGMFANDIFGDARDRWRTMSAIYGVEIARKTAPQAQSYTFSLRGEMISPDNVSGTGLVPDRRYAGVLEALGTHNWFHQTFEVQAGVGLALIGPATGMGQLQDAYHDLVGFPSVEVLDDQVPNALYPVAGVSLARRWAVGRKAALVRVEAKTGVETFLRAGFELTFGPEVLNRARMRDPVTGFALTTRLRDPKVRGLSLMVGGDVSYIAQSHLFPAGGVSAHRQRTRLRIGLTDQHQGYSSFIGFSWHSPEFKEQSEGQVLGSFAIKYRF